MRCDAAWLISGWEPLGNVIDYLAENQADVETRLQLVSEISLDLDYF